MSDIIFRDIQWSVDSKEVPSYSILSQPLSWNVDKNGKVILQIYVGYEIDSENYRDVDDLVVEPSQVRDGYHLLGAIYSFLNLQEVDQRYVISRLKNKEQVVEFVIVRPKGPYYRIDAIDPDERLFKGIMPLADGYYHVVTG